MTSLLRKSMTQFIACIAILFALAAPAFYYLTINTNDHTLRISNTSATD